MRPVADISYISRVTITGNHSPDGRDESLTRGRIQLSTAEIEGCAPEILGKTECFHERNFARQVGTVDATIPEA